LFFGAPNSAASRKGIPRIRRQQDQRSEQARRARSTKQKRFQSLNQTSLLGLSAIPIDDVGLFEIATTLLLSMHVLSLGMWHTKVSPDVIIHGNS
jgi:hypothetical protein